MRIYWIAFSPLSIIHARYNILILMESLNPIPPETIFDSLEVTPNMAINMSLKPAGMSETLELTDNHQLYVTCKVQFLTMVFKVQCKFNVEQYFQKWEQSYFNICMSKFLLLLCINSFLGSYTTTLTTLIWIWKILEKNDNLRNKIYLCNIYLFDHILRYYFTSEGWNHN